MANPSYIGTLGKSMELYLAKATARPELSAVSSKMASGAVRTQWGTRVVQHYECAIDAYEADVINFIRSLRYTQQNCWFVDGIGYETNALPYYYSTTDANFLRLTGYAESAPAYINKVSRMNWLPPGDEPRSIIPTALTLNQPMDFTLKLPLFKGKKWNFSLYVKDSPYASISSAGAGSAAPKQTTDWERISISGTAANSGYLTITLSQMVTFTGMQLTWGSTDLKPFSVGMGIQNAQISDFSNDHYNLIDRILTPANFTIDEVPL